MVQLTLDFPEADADHTEFLDDAHNTNHPSSLLYEHFQKEYEKLHSRTFAEQKEAYYALRALLCSHGIENFASLELKINKYIGAVKSADADDRRYISNAINFFLNHNQHTYYTQIISLMLEKQMTGGEAKVEVEQALHTAMQSTLTSVRAILQHRARTGQPRNAK